MFPFDNWADWLQAKAGELNRESLICTYGDTRGIPECASNPACSIEVTSAKRVGRLSFWQGGTCDYEILDSSTYEFVANEAGLEANDDSIVSLVDRFLSVLAA